MATVEELDQLAGCVRHLRRVQREQRLDAANALIRCIAERGRHFFRQGSAIARLALDARDRVWFIDAYTSKRILTHYVRGGWRGFSEGGTLRGLVICLRDFVCKGKQLQPLTFGPWPEWICGGDLWGYGQDMQAVRELAATRRIIKEVPCDART